MNVEWQYGTYKNLYTLLSHHEVFTVNIYARRADLLQNSY